MFVELVLENSRVGIDAAVHPLAELERRVCEPLLVIFCRHFIPPVFPSHRGRRLQRVILTEVSFHLNRDMGSKVPISKLRARIIRRARFPCGRSVLGRGDIPPRSDNPCFGGKTPNRIKPVDLIDRTSSSYQPDIRLCAVSSRCSASLSPGCPRHDPQQHGEHGR